MYHQVEIVWTDSYGNGLDGAVRAGKGVCSLGPKQLQDPTVGLCLGPLVVLVGWVVSSERGIPVNQGKVACSLGPGMLRTLC